MYGFRGEVEVAGYLLDGFEIILHVCDHTCFGSGRIQDSE